MTIHSFVYSNNPRYRLFRHLIFWIGWISYFVFINTTRSGSRLIGMPAFMEYTLFEMLIVLSVDIVFCYAVMYLLIPKMLLREKYWAFFLFIGLFLLLDASLSSYFYTWLVNPLRKMFGLPELTYIAFTDLLRGLNGVMMITGVAVSIKFSKLWNIKKQELYLVKSEKISRELKFIDTYIQPSFLPALLKKIYAYAYATNNKVPEMLEKLQKIISFLIDECNQPTILLAHEIDAIKDFILLEKLTNTNRYTIDYQQSGEPGELRIVPYLLFPFVETNFRQLNDHITDKHWTNISLELEGTKLSLQVKNSKPVETSNLLNLETTNLLQMRKRLDLLYPGSYKVNMVIEENSFAIQLEIDLSKAING
jgi:hypothetical protein